MEIQKTHGIVLSSRSCGEADIIGSVYTRDYGKRAFLFKGLRKSRKRPLAGKEPGTSLHLTYYYHPEKDAHIVNEFSIIESLQEFHESMPKAMHLCYILETVEKTTGESICDQSIFNLLHGGIKALARAQQPPFLSAFFLIRLLNSHGILPTLGTCKSCGKKDPECFTFDPLDMRQICGECSRHGMGSGSSLPSPVFFTHAAQYFISLALSRKFDAMNFSLFSEKETLDFLVIASGFMEGYFQIALKSKRFIVPNAVFK